MRASTYQSVFLLYSFLSRPARPVEGPIVSYPEWKQERQHQAQAAQQKAEKQQRSKFQISMDIRNPSRLPAVAGSPNWNPEKKKNPEASIYICTLICPSVMDDGMSVGFAF
ncbi:hypothetical protein F5B20DRAFT_575431 [Whalleya microplaca]|nr:hypothetical protein F5B20DRAFT_575431 [Whalleya microplaca]